MHKMGEYTYYIYNEQRPFFVTFYKPHMDMTIVIFLGICTVIRIISLGLGQQIKTMVRHLRFK